MEAGIGFCRLPHSTLRRNWLRNYRLQPEYRGSTHLLHFRHEQHDFLTTIAQPVGSLLWVTCSHRPAAQRSPLYSPKRSSTLPGAAPARAAPAAVALALRLRLFVFRLIVMNAHQAEGVGFSPHTGQSSGTSSGPLRAKKRGSLLCHRPKAASRNLNVGSICVAMKAGSS